MLAIFGKSKEKKAAELAPVAPVAPVLSSTEELKTLSALHDSGGLTDEEFTHEKERVLAHH